MVSDAGEQLHYGLVQPGGYTPFRSLQPEDRRHMFNVERANMVAMGSARYMGAIEAQNHGVSHGDDTDMMESEKVKRGREILPSSQGPTLAKPLRPSGTS